ncbi:hypothetical protein ABPG74_021536 [Tetrahymena malaccensis]
MLSKAIPSLMSNQQVLFKTLSFTQKFVKSFSSTSKIPNGRPQPRKEWNPVEHGLSQDFVLTNFRDIISETPDVSVRPIRNTKSKKIISTIDFFYPNVHDPYLQGRISACNVLSDLYSMAVTDIDVVLMVLAVSNRMNETEREVVTSLMIQGFDECANDAGAFVLGGQTIFNPWPIIGGVGIAAVEKNEFIMPNDAVAGDVIILTKPLGTQLAVNAMQWLTSYKDKYEKISKILSPEEVKQAFKKAEYEMGTLNMFAAHLMKKYDAHACTDVTGFGIKGHSQFLASVQKQKVDLVIDNLPIIKNMARIDNTVKDYRLKQGFSAETSGGLLICLPKQNAKDFIQEMHDNGLECNYAGVVVNGANNSVVLEGATIEDV